MPFPDPDHQFRPGTSGNPGGRPSGRSLTARLREILDRDAGDGRTVAELIATALIDAARVGNLKAIREVFDRTEGRPRPAEVEPAQGEARDAWQELHDELAMEGDGRPEHDPAGPDPLP